MIKIIVLVATIILPALIAGQAINVRTCAGGRPAPHQVRIQGCSSMPCDVRRGTDAVMEFDFTPAATAHDLTPTVRATVLGLTVNYPLPPAVSDSCSNLVDSSCPVLAGQRRTLVFRFPVNQSYPPVPVAVELTLSSHDNTVVSCFSVDIRVRA